MHRRAEFDAARRPQAAAGGPAGRFRPERMYPDSDKRVVAAAPRNGRWEKEEEEASGSGYDPELAAARIYLRRIGAGLRNLGNTCYLNSVLQCLTYTEPFVAYLHSGKHKSSCRTAGFCALCALENHVRCALQSTGKIVTPTQIVKNLRCISRSFCNSRQEDAHELMVNLLESMHKCCLPSGIPSQSPSAYEKSLVHRIFGGRLKSEVRCANCSHCSSKFDPFLDLSLEIDNAATLVKALQNFTEEELLDGGEKQYNCQHCRQKVVAKKRFTIDKAPDVLTIHLKRFSPFNPLQKIDKRVDFQPTLNLKPFVNNPGGMDFKYSLYGVLVHAGWNTQSGHYYCFVQTSSGIWHNFDDNKVHQVRQADVLRQQAYMLFYVRDKVRQPVTCKYNGTNISLEKKVVFEKITCMNGTIRNGLMEAALNVSSVSSGDVKLRKQNSDDGHPSIISNSSQGQCSKNHTSTGVIEAAASQSNGSTDSSKGTTAALPICNGADRLLGANARAPESQTDCTGVNAQTMQTKDPAVYSGSISNTEDHAYCDEAKSVKPVNQHDEIVTAKELSVENIVAVANSAEQASLQNNEVEAVWVNSEKQIHSEDSTHVIYSEVSAHAICPEDSAQGLGKDECHGGLHKKKDIKSKRRATKPAFHLFFRSKQPFLSALKLRKKRKHKRSTRRSTFSMDIENVADDQQTSTSETALTRDAPCKSHRHKRSRASLSSDSGDQVLKNKQQHAGATSSISYAKENEIQCPRTSSIGHMSDQWDDEHDRGRRKKARKSKKQLSRLNPFQDTSDGREKRLKTDDAKSGNQKSRT